MEALAEELKKREAILLNKEAMLAHIIFKFLDLVLLFLHFSLHFYFPVSLFFKLLLELILLIFHPVNVHLEFLNFLFPLFVQGAYFFIVLWNI